MGGTARSWIEGVVDEERIMTRRRGVVIGAGGFAGVWGRTFLPEFRDRLEIVAIADINPEALNRSADALGVPESRRYSTYERMLGEVQAEVCFIIIPPAARTNAVRLAAERGMAVFCEKPMAASWEQALEIAGIVRQTGITFAVVQNYRLTNRIRALKEVLERPEMGAINVVQCRMAVNYTIDTAGGAFRHQIPDAMIYEGAEHHIDQLRNLVDADGEWVQGAQWGQPWSTFDSNTCVSLIIGMTNGTVAQFEMNHIDRGHQNGWHQEYYRVACEGGTVTLDADHIVRVTRHIAKDHEVVEEIVPDSDPHDGHFAVIRQFLDWLDGGSPPVTVLEDNLKSMALTFAAVEATHTGDRVDVTAFTDMIPDRMSATASS